MDARCCSRRHLTASSRAWDHTPGRRRSQLITLIDSVDLLGTDLGPRARGVRGLAVHDRPVDIRGDRGGGMHAVAVRTGCTCPLPSLPRSTLTDATRPHCLVAAETLDTTISSSQWGDHRDLLPRRPGVRVESGGVHDGAEGASDVVSVHRRRDVRVLVDGPTLLVGCQYGASPDPADVAQRHRPAHHPTSRNSGTSTLTYELGRSVLPH